MLLFFCFCRPVTTRWQRLIYVCILTCGPLPFKGVACTKAQYKQCYMHLPLLLCVSVWQRWSTCLNFTAVGWTAEKFSPNHRTKRCGFYHFAHRGRNNFLPQDSAISHSQNLPVLVNLTMNVTRLQLNYTLVKWQDVRRPRLAWDFAICSDFIWVSHLLWDEWPHMNLNSYIISPLSVLGPHFLWYHFIWLKHCFYMNLKLILISPSTTDN